MRRMDLKLFLGVPAALLGMFTVIKLVLGFFGVDFLSPGRKLGDHVNRSAAYHAALDSIVKLHEVEDQKDRAALESVLIGECLENPCNQLAQQRALSFCFRQDIMRCRQWRDSP